MDNTTADVMNFSVPDNITVSYSGKTLQEYNDEEANRRLIPVIYLAILMAIGIPGNIMVLIVYPFKFPKTSHRIYITGLAVADLLVCVITLPFEIIEMRLQYTFYNVGACKFFRTCNTIFALSSILILMFLSGDRYRRICKPFKRQMTTRHANILIIISVVFAVLFSWPNLLITGIRLVDLDNNITGYDCSLSDQYAKTIFPTVMIGILFLMFIICIITLIVLYSLIGYKLFTHFRAKKKYLKSSTSISKPVASNPNTTDDLDEASSSVSQSTASTSVSNQDHKSVENPTRQEFKNEAFNDNMLTSDRTESPPKKSKSTKRQSRCHSTKESEASRKLAKIAFTISVAFILSYLPHLVVSLATAIKGKFLFPPGPVVSAVLPIVTRSFAINNVVNPIIYGFMDKRFRDNLRQLCTCNK